MTTEGTIYDTLAAIKPTWAVVADQGAALPRFTFSRVVGVLHETVADGGGALRGRFQIDSWAQTYGEAKANAALAKTALRNALTVAEVIDNPDDRDEETKIFRASFDIAVWE